MKRGEAVNWIINIMSDIGKSEHRALWHYEQALMEIRQMLELMPSDEWIPCNERMPDKDGRYLCTNSDIRAIWDTSINVWSEGEWLFDYTAPIAWMELPEPYREVAK